MRLVLLFLLLTGGLLAQTPPSKNPSLVLPASRPAPDTLPPLLLPKLNLGQTAPATPPAMAAIDGRAFFPKDVFSSVESVPLPETRTPAQLEALLASYVGTWRGPGATYYLSARKTLRYPVELVYKFEQYQGHRVLSCVGTYQLPGGPQVLHERLWVNKGHIVAELFEGSRQQSFAAHSSGQSLVWYSTDSLESLLSFGQAETLRLTPDGGQLMVRGFEVQRSPLDTTTIYQTADLKLVKN